MPTYHFRCPKGHDTERFYKTMSSAPMELECPECGASAARQMSAGAGLLFKGSGFYLTDYGKNAHRGTAPDTKGDSKGESAKGEATKSDPAKAGSPKSESPKAESTPKAESPPPKAAPKPKSE